MKKVKFDNVSLREEIATILKGVFSGQDEEEISFAISMIEIEVIQSVDKYVKQLKETK